MWQWHSSTNQWHIYTSINHPAVHISVSVDDSSDYHATNQHNQLHMDRDGTVSRGNAFLRQDFEERYKLSLAISSFLTWRSGGPSSGAVDRGKVIDMR